ncbi:MAG: hypothetical protein KDE34_24920 [Anaerolineales bacterium]|nr:hypothetical protein [Anaerolineales bacterium]MCB8961066.1 hypothetical protein [Ardenticatenales bacterium]
MKNKNQQPEEFSDAILLAYLAGDVSETVRQQIEADETLLARAQELNYWDQIMAVAYEEIDCPQPEEILLYHHGLLERERMQAIRNHLELATGCSCAAELQQLALGEKKTAERSSDYLWERIKATGKRLLEAIQVPGLEQPALALRGHEPQRHVFKAGEYLVVVMLTPPLTEDDYWQLEGQITHQGQVGPELQGQAQIYLARTKVAEDAVDEFGYFSMEEVPAGAIELRIETAGMILKPIGFKL